MQKAVYIKVSPDKRTDFYVYTLRISIAHDDKNEFFVWTL